METPLRSRRSSKDVCPWTRVPVQRESGNNRVVACNVTRAGCILHGTVLLFVSRDSDVSYPFRCPDGGTRTGESAHSHELSGRATLNLLREKAGAELDAIIPGRDLDQFPGNNILALPFTFVPIKPRSNRCTRFAAAISFDGGRFYTREPGRWPFENCIRF